MNVPPVLVVTGTDTGVGKTVVTAAVAATLARSRTVAAFKPVQTGAALADPPDVEEIARLSGIGTAREGVRLAAALAPVAAARLAGTSLPGLARHLDLLADLGRTHDVVLVEGSGGLLVDLDAGGNGLCELAAASPAPAAFVVVARAGLGTLNHTRLTVEALRVRGLAVAGVVVGADPEEPGPAERENVRDLPAVAGVPVLGRVPAGAAALDPVVFRSRAPSWFEGWLG